MPKANKHAEVKPSKYKTSLCQFYLKGETCPFAARCAFAHGEEELQSESKNVELLKATGLQRLDRGGLDEVATVSSKSNSLSEYPLVKATATPLDSPTTLSEEQRSHNSSHSSSRTDSFTAPPPVQSRPFTPTASAAVRQRRPVMVSLPKYSTANDCYDSPYTNQQETYGYAQFSLQRPEQQPHYITAPPHISRHPQEPLQPMFSQRPQCACGFGATCRLGQPTTYRHNPYGRLTTHTELY